MRVVVVGLGIQGRKRLAIAGPDAVASVDPEVAEAGFRSLKDVPLERYDAALLCVPDAAKLELLEYLLEHRKHALVEKPLLAPARDLERLAALAARSQSVSYTAYNHRFEPHFVRMKRVLESGRLGRVYRCRISYGNGTARDVRGSPWRDRGAGVLPDLGSHMLDTLRFWFGDPGWEFRVSTAHRFENRSFDHVVVASERGLSVELEGSLVSWRNDLHVDVVGEAGSAHIESLCKWGPSSFIERTRVLPSGRPPERALTLTQADPTWELEYAHFLGLCDAGGPSSFENDRWIAAELEALTSDALERWPA
jgi:predicted dehydrogenase